MERQTAFDLVVEHLKKDGRPSRIDRKCLYRGPEGRKCFAGVLIPDELYQPSMDDSPIGKSIGYVMRLYSEVGILLGREDDNFFLALQNCHDNLVIYGISEEGFKVNAAQELRRFAARYCLDASQLSEESE